MRHFLLYFKSLLMLGVDTNTTSIAEMLPTILDSAILQLVEGDVIGPLITNIDFPGPGIVHSTPKISKLTAETDDSSTAQAISSQAYSGEGTGSASATVGVHNASVLLKDIASLGSIDDMAAIAGQLIGECLIVQKETDLLALFTALSTNQGVTATSVNLTPGDLYDAYGSLRGSFAPLPYNLVMGPDLIWSTVGVISLFDNSADAVQSRGLGTVGEDFARTGFAGMALGFSLYADANIAADASYISDGIAFSKAVAKNVVKRGFGIELQRDASEIGTEIVGSDMRGESLLRNKHGNLMSFATT